MLKTHRIFPLSWAQPSFLFSLFSFLCFSLLSAQSPYNAPGDTLTVIQSPILNIPAIHIPGETLYITCDAPSTASGWQAFLLHGSKTIPLSLTGSQFLAQPPVWQLTTTVPPVPVYELYDLKVTASGGIEDVTRNAVQIIPTRKESFYFVHLTDLHLPTQIYYPDAGYDTDSTSVNDFRAVIDDINLINPEFVLLTGDLINEGELEGFNGLYYYGWAQRLLEEIQVPCYVTSGNHDIGGWNSTPPSQGSARRNWWKYFGWSWLDSTDSNWFQHTQDYGFTYGDLHLIGMEAYDNYDNWRANIYGGQSFIYSQIMWLNDELALHPDKNKVFFYHYDFSDQINLSSLGIDLALWGHIHYNSGSLSTYPYNLATRSVCSGNRSYRPVRVNGGQVTPLSTIYAGSSGTSLFVNYYPSNAGVADSVMAVLTNNQSVAFEHSRLKFVMPPGNYSYSVTNGILEQVDSSGPYNVCYVKVNLGANTVRYVSCAAHASSSPDDAIPNPAPLIKAAYPNPFRDRLCLELDQRVEGRAELTLYNLRGEAVANLSNQSGYRDIDPFLPAGIYFLKASWAGRTETRRLLKVK
jgi:3',5'-cyclic AMP phosphodiesterase CpdA